MDEGSPGRAAILIEEIIDRLLELDPETRERLTSLDGKVICLELAADTEPLRLYIVPDKAGVRLRRAYPGLPDVTIAGTPAVFLRQLTGPAVSAELKIRGDVDLGSRFQRAVSGFAPDWEEGLARVVGDFPARQIGNVTRALVDFGRRAVRTLGQDTAEYLLEEGLVAAPRARVQAFLNEVDKLRMDVDRLEKRLERLTDLARDA
ncbi:sterol-binding protein [Sulfurifustis variabilis]|uniref:Ubiquinone biosynthesis accessory factor UbiJ n=1 Tax=Sulfurifustis variabilis TaxID=1675686 RepID=A0A1B4VAI0_9GAMM|nr:SCP2 sterol-binding domain-containing protein [Sulfurifustis variabilis]BAU46991.1 sterol-binding protein [Sulfurifustis variabilis]